MSVSANGNRSFRRGDPADRDLLLHEVDLGLFHRELEDYEELLLLLPLAQPKVRYGRSQAGEPKCRPVLPLGKTVAGSRIERPTVDIEPHGIAVVRGIFLQDPLREGNRSFRGEGREGQVSLQLDGLPRFGRKGHQGIGLRSLPRAQAVHVDPEFSQRGLER